MAGRRRGPKVFESIESWIDMLKRAVRSICLQARCSSRSSGTHTIPFFLLLHSLGSFHATQALHTSCLTSPFNSRFFSLPLWPYLPHSQIKTKNEDKLHFCPFEINGSQGWCGFRVGWGGDEDFLLQETTANEWGQGALGVNTLP